MGRAGAAVRTARAVCQTERMALINYITQVQLDFGALALLAAGARARRHRQAAARHRRRRARRRPARPRASRRSAAGRTRCSTRRRRTRPSARCARRPSVYRRRTAATAWSRSAAARASTSPRASRSRRRIPGPLTTYATIEGGSAQHQRARRAADRGADDGRHRQRGRARRDRHRRRRQEARLPQLAPRAQGGDLRPRADARPAAVPHRGDRHGRDRALHGDLHGAGGQSARRRHRASTASSARWAHIERATRDGSDREARLNMMSASMQGAMAFQKGLGCVHSLSHSLGGANPKLHHGTLNAMFLPAVVRFNASAPIDRQGAPPRAHGARDGPAVASQRRARRRRSPTRSAT